MSLLGADASLIGFLAPCLGECFDPSVAAVGLLEDLHRHADTALLVAESAGLDDVFATPDLAGCSAATTVSLVSICSASDPALHSAVTIFLPDSLELQLW